MAMSTVNMKLTKEEVLPIVSEYVDSNIFNSGIWDSLDSKMKTKAIYNAYSMLRDMLPDIFSTDVIELTDLTSQIMWIIKQDDSTDRAAQGAIMLTMGEMTMMFDKSKTGVLIAPEIINKYGLDATGKRRRVGAYRLNLEDTARTGFYKGTKERFRYE